MSLKRNLNEWSIYFIPKVASKPARHSRLHAATLGIQSWTGWHFLFLILSGVCFYTQVWLAQLISLPNVIPEVFHLSSLNWVLCKLLLMCDHLEEKTSSSLLFRGLGWIYIEMVGPVWQCAILGFWPGCCRRLYEQKASLWFHNAQNKSESEFFKF